jgi:hypothetical protein
VKTLVKYKGKRKTYFVEKTAKVGHAVDIVHGKHRLHKLQACNFWVEEVPVKISAIYEWPYCKGEKK